MSNPNFFRPQHQAPESERLDNKRFKYSDIFTISPEDLEFLTKKASTPEMRAKAAQGQAHIKVAHSVNANHAMGLKGSAERISVLDSIKQNPETFNRYKLKERSEWRTMNELWTWTEKRDFSADEELEFVQTAKRLGEGNFTEIMQMSFVTESGRLIKGVDMSGGAEVDWDTISSLYARLDEEASERIRAIYIVHNHSDYLAKTKIPKDHPPDKFIERNGLSISDVDLADKFKQGFDQKYGNVTVTMIAVDEMGLTHSYEAGGSKISTRAEWEKKNKV